MFTFFSIWKLWRSRLYSENHWNLWLFIAFTWGYLFAQLNSCSQIGEFTPFNEGSDHGLQFSWQYLPQWPNENLFIISNNSNIAKFKIKNVMDVNILVFFVSEMYREKKLAANLNKYLCAFIFSSSATIVTSPKSKLWLWINQQLSLFFYAVLGFSFDCDKISTREVVFKIILISKIKTRFYSTNIRLNHYLIFCHL